MCKKTIVFLMLLLGFTVLRSQTISNAAIDVMLKGYEPKVLTETPVTDSQIKAILECGLKAPSARNSQLWKFTVVKDKAVIDEFIPNFTPGNILIIISGEEFAPEGSNVDIDCSVAMTYMYVAAESLGLGGHIYTAQVPKINSTGRKKLAIPEGNRVVALLRIGNMDKNVDAVSAASTRYKFADMVNYQ